MKEILSYILKFIHLILSLTLIFLPYITNNIIILSILSVIYILTISQWYIFGYCLLSPIENLLTGNSEHDVNNSFMSQYFKNKFNINDHNLKILCTLIPLINFTVCIIKINLYKCKK